jgi:hypothetical protein
MGGGMTDGENSGHGGCRIHWFRIGQTFGLAGRKPHFAGSGQSEVAQIVHCAVYPGNDRLEIALAVYMASANRNLPA